MATVLGRVIETVVGGKYATPLWLRAVDLRLLFDAAMRGRREKLTAESRCGWWDCGAYTNVSLATSRSRAH